MHDALHECKVCGAVLVTPQNAIPWTVCAKCHAADDTGSLRSDIERFAKKPATKEMRDHMDGLLGTDGDVPHA